ncbi:MAG: DUF2849 domain-containing protein [Gammaproteobacteria bacterium]
MTQALTANRLGDGRVVFLTSTGDWSADLSAARLAEEADAQAELQTIGEQAEADCVIVGPYLIEVRDTGSTIEAVEIRESIRAKGPTVQAGQF